MISLKSSIFPLGAVFLLALSYTGCGSSDAGRVTPPSPPAVLSNTPLNGGTGVALTGSATDVWIFQIAQNLTMISLRTGASINGRLLAQTAVTIDGSTMAEPAP